MHVHMRARARVQVEPQLVVQGLNATADSFYSSQGRTGPHFADGNVQLIEQLLEQHPNLVREAGGRSAA
jgi:uridine phosphorylase